MAKGSNLTTISLTKDQIAEVKKALGIKNSQRIPSKIVFTSIPKSASKLIRINKHLVGSVIA